SSAQNHLKTHGVDLIAKKIDGSHLEKALVHSSVEYHDIRLKEVFVQKDNLPVFLGETDQKDVWLAIEVSRIPNWHLRHKIEGDFVYVLYVIPLRIKSDSFVATKEHAGPQCKFEPTLNQFTFVRSRNYIIDLLKVLGDRSVIFLLDITLVDVERWK